MGKNALRGIYLLIVTAALSAPSAFAVTGEVKVFDPDPRTHLNDLRLRDSSAPERFTNAYVLRALPEITSIGPDQYLLRNSHVVLGDFEPPANATTVSGDGRFHFVRGEQGFLDAMAFYHLDTDVRYLQSLGFTGANAIGNTPLKVDSNALYGARGGLYIPSENLILLGTGCIDAAEDADQIRRLFFYSVVHALKPDLSGGDVSAILEALADYWAVSRSMDSDNGSENMTDQLFQWSGHDGCGSVRSIGNSEVVYDPQKTYSGNEKITGGLSNELISVPLYRSLQNALTLGFEKSDLDKIIIDSVFEMQNDMTIADWGVAFYQNLKNYEYPVEIWEIFANEFQLKKVFPSSDIQYSNLVYRSEAGGNIGKGSVVIVDFTVSNIGNLDASNLKMELTSPNSNIQLIDSIWQKDALEKNETETVVGQLKFKILENSSCEQGPIKVISTLTSEDVFKSTEVSFERSFELDRIFKNVLVGREIPDDDPSGFTSEIVVEDNITNFEIQVGVDINHEYRDEIYLEITNPAGVTVKLWNGSDGSSDGLKGVFPTSLQPAEPMDPLTGFGSKGVWKVKVWDDTGGDIGLFNSWSLRLHSKNCE